jgi:hypothetical protein
VTLTTTVALNTNDSHTVGMTVFALVTPTAFSSGEFLAATMPEGAFYGQEVKAGNAYAGLGSGLCHRKPKLLPTCSGQHTFRAISFGVVKPV